MTSPPVTPLASYLTLQWTRIDPNGPGLHEPKLPGDVGWDLATATDITLHAGAHSDVPTNVRVKLPVRCWAEIRARSSIAARGLMIAATVIDNGYTGPLQCLLYNINHRPNGDTDWTGAVRIPKGERIAQLVLHQQMHDVRGLEVDELPDDPRRGSRGFGSTGVA